MKILGHRLLVSKIDEPKGDGFQTVEVQDSFVYKGFVEMIGTMINIGSPIDIGQVVLFAKYSPDTQEVEHEGKKMKIINADDVLAIL